MGRHRVLSPTQLMNFKSCQSTAFTHCDGSGEAFATAVWSTKARKCIEMYWLLLLSLQLGRGMQSTLATMGPRTAENMAHSAAINVTCWRKRHYELQSNEKFNEKRLFVAFTCLVVAICEPVESFCKLFAQIAAAWLRKGIFRRTHIYNSICFESFFAVCNPQNGCCSFKLYFLEVVRRSFELLL